jgi:subtilisin
MSDERLPAWSRESAVLRLPGVASLEDLTPEWAFEGATGRGVRVAVIDSGIEADHPALGGCVDADAGISVAVGADGQVVRTEGAHGDSFGHATACAGIIHSLAPEARLTSVKVLGEGLTGKVAAFLDGLAWAIEQRFDVINLSLGTRKRDMALAFYELCDRAYFNGSFVVTAANNVQQPSFPSLYASVTSVACNLATDPRRFHYNPEPPTEFLARGIDVEVAWRGGATITGTGNSYAAPHIAGLAAAIISKHPGLRPFQVKTVLWATAANVQEAPMRAGRLSRMMTGAQPASRLSRVARL